MKKGKKLFILTIAMILIGVLGDNNQTQAIPIYGFSTASSGEVSKLSWELGEELVKTKMELIATKLELEGYKKSEEYQFIQNEELRSRIRRLEELESLTKVLKIVEENRRLNNKVQQLQGEKRYLHRQNRNLHTGGGCAGDC